MKTLVTGAGSYLTGDEIADAVLEYWLRLSHEDRADLVEIPFLTVEGRRSRVTLAVGSTTNLAALDSTSDAVLIDTALVESLSVKGEGRTPDAGTPLSPAEVPELRERDSFIWL